MVNIREYHVNWGGKVSGLSVVYGVQSVASVSVQREALNFLLSGFIAEAATGVTYAIANDGKVLESSDGSLTDTWFDTADRSGTGGSTVEGPVAQATQVYVRFTTNVVRNNRQLAGGIYLPGLRTDGLDINGELGTAEQTAVQGAANSMVSASSGLCIWGRPRAGLSDGVFGVITGAVCRSELSVQRNRRRA